MREQNAVDKYIRINPKSHMLEPNWMWRDVLPFALGPDAALYSSGIIALPTASPVTVPYKLPHSSLGYDDAVGSPLQINQIVYTANPTTTPDFTVFIADMGDQRQYMNFPVHVDTIAGTGQLSARLTEDLFLPTRHQLMVTFQRIADNDNNRQLYFIGKYFDTWSSNLQGHPKDHTDMIAMVNRALERRKYVTPYWLTTENGVVNVPANQTVEIDTLVGDEGHLEVTHILRAFSDYSDTTLHPFEVELINPQTRQTLMNGKIHSQFIGNAQNPQPFPCPFIIPAGQILRFRITDLSGSANAVYLTLRGMRIRAPFKSRAEVEKEFGLAGKPIPKTNARHTEMAGVR